MMIDRGYSIGIFKVEALVLVRLKTYSSKHDLNADFIRIAPNELNIQDSGNGEWNERDWRELKCSSLLNSGLVKPLMKRSREQEIQRIYEVDNNRAKLRRFGKELEGAKNTASLVHCSSLVYIFILI